MKYRARCVKEPGRPILGVIDNKMLRLKRLERLRVAPALEIKMRWLVSLWPILKVSSGLICGTKWQTLLTLSKTCPALGRDNSVILMSYFASPVFVRTCYVRIHLFEFLRKLESGKLRKTKQSGERSKTDLLGSRLCQST